MSTPAPVPSSSSSNRNSMNISPLFLYLLTLTLVSAIVVPAAFYLIFDSLTIAILTFILYFIALVCVLGLRRVLDLLFRPRYEMLSARRRDEVDLVRERGLKRLLGRFTLTLEKEQMIQKSRTITSSTASCTSSSSSLHHSDSSSSERSEEVDLELGLAQNDNDVISSPFTADHYTHVRIPCRQQDMEVEEVAMQSSPSDIIDSTTTLTPTQATRDVSINCSICLSAMEPSQNICWSSNSQCPDVFHESCIVKWFVEMGRRDRIIIAHGKKLDEERLLNYTFSCPCCTRSFVQDEVRKGAGKEEMIEEVVAEEEVVEKEEKEEKRTQDTVSSLPQ